MKVDITFDGDNFNSDVAIDSHDLWSLDITLANIIYPALVEFDKSCNSYPHIPESDIPEGFEDAQSYWQWILQEMIWTFEQISLDGKAEDQFYSDEEPEDTEGWMQIASFTEDSSFWCNQKAMDEFYKRIKQGTNLFGKYYLNLWT